MGQVLKISTTDFRALHLSMGGRLVPSDLLDEARGRELRVSAIESRNVGKSDRDFQRAVNIQYQRATQHAQASLHKSSAAQEINPEALPLTKQKAATRISTLQAIRSARPQKIWKRMPKGRLYHKRKMPAIYRTGVPLR